MNILKSYKAEPTKVNINDPFDYNYHEVLSSVERDDVSNNIVIYIIQDGWKLDKELIQYAKVIVSRKPKPPEPEPEEEEEKEEKKKDEVGKKEIKDTKEESPTKVEEKEKPKE